MDFAEDNWKGLPSLWHEKAHLREIADLKL